ncbi:MAG TPA: 5-(carboxyamino)imidazole ribonucleotide mutase [Candidatus Saccharimonadales bacterium]|nr:5-(carboxyamino)imidazole ribonucleotide mutase [Candidatus Saccharimonadales bacterium]
MNDKILVSVVMPNEKDLEIMNESIVTLKSLGISCEVTVISAHRAPHQMIEYVKNAKERGIKVFIATAKGAAHLPGMIAAFTILPVIAVPLKSPLLDGLDSIFSMLQMPDSVPVATVSVNGARNAAILAAQILGLHYDNISAELERLKIQLSSEVEEQAVNIKSKVSTE